MIADYKKIFIIIVLSGVAVLAGCAPGGAMAVHPADPSKKDPGYHCRDTDGGLNPGVKGKVVFGRYDYEDHCATGGEDSRVNRVVADFGDVIEYSCYDAHGSPVCSPGACRYSVLKCPPGETCYRGKCGPSADNPDLWPGSAGCEDSDNGLNYYMRGRIKYRFPPPNDRVAQYAMDECENATVLHEGYCIGSGYRAEGKRCEYLCACGRCFREGEKIDCRADFNQYCNNESCYVISRDIDDIKFISQNKEPDNCIAARKCEAFAGRYEYKGREIIARVELNAGLNFLELAELVRKRHGSEPGMFRSNNFTGDIIGIDEMSRHCREVTKQWLERKRPLHEFEKKIIRQCDEEKNVYHHYWISDRNVVYVKAHLTRAEINRSGLYDEFLDQYLRVHPSDVLKPLNSNGSSGYRVHDFRPFCHMSGSMQVKTLSRRYS